MIALALLLACIGDSNVAGYGLRPSEPSFAQVLDCQTSAHPGFGVLRGGQLVIRAAVHEATVRARWYARPDVLVLSIGANDIAWTAQDPERIAETIGKRYREAQSAAARVLVIEPAVNADGDGPVATALRERRAAVVAALPRYADPADIVDTDVLGPGEFSDALHWNLSGHLAVVEAVLGVLER